MRTAPKVVLSPEDEKVLRKLAGGKTCSVRLAQRSQIVLLASQGLENREIASELGVDRGTVGRWRRRYCLFGLQGIEKDAYRPGRKPSVTPDKVSEVIERRRRVRHRMQPNGVLEQWQTRSASALPVSGGFGRSMD